MENRRQTIAGIGEPVTEAISHLENFVLNGGKRIRPLYAWAGFVGAQGLKGEEDPSAVLTAVSSLEFIQACALIHDDIIDASDTRRGQATVHRQVEGLHKDRRWIGSAEHFGHSAAVLIGDMALVWAEDMLQDSGISQAGLQRTREPWRAMRTEVIGGQLLDIYLESSGSESITKAQSVNRFKTAAYTIERPLHLGAALAGADEATITAFRGYGKDIGIAFQLRDDLLGVFGEPDITGKPAGDDLREGKRTVLVAEALKRARPKDAAVLRAGIGTVSTPEEITELTQIIASSGAPEAIEQQIDQLKASGLAHLEAAGVDDGVTETLSQLAFQATKRRF